MDPIDIYTKIQPLIQKEIQSALEDKDEKINAKGLFKVDSVYHSHNGVDGPRVHAADLDWTGISLPITGRSLNLPPGGNIQQAMDTLHGYGGGTLYLQSGTYYPSTALSGYSSIKIVGISPSQTIIDFNSTSNNLSFGDTNAYATGTITAASGTAITGSGTSWSTNVVAGEALFLGTRWYTIASVTDNTHLVLAEAYGDNVTLPANYRIAYPAKDFMVSSLTIKNSTGTGLVTSGCRQFFISDIIIQSCNIGHLAQNVSEMAIDEQVIVSSTSDGVQWTNVGLCNVSSLDMSGNGGHGLKMNNVKTIYMQPSSSTANTSDGYNITTGVDITMLANASANGGQGIEMVSNCQNIVIMGAPVQGNTSDGIKLTASCTGIKITNNDIQGNGGYGTNIAVVGDTATLLVGNYFASNTSGQVNNAGTGSIGRGNYNVADFG